MKDSGWMINNMDMVQKHGLIMQNMKENMKTETSTDKGFYILLMGLNTKEISNLTILMDKEHTYGQITEFIWVNGAKIK